MSDVQCPADPGEHTLLKKENPVKHIKSPQFWGEKEGLKKRRRQDAQLPISILTVRSDTKSLQETLKRVKNNKINACKSVTGMVTCIT